MQNNFHLISITRQIETDALQITQIGGKGIRHGIFGQGMSRPNQTNLSLHVKKREINPPENARKKTPPNQGAAAEQKMDHEKK